jgi:hypothetical protein
MGDYVPLTLTMLNTLKWDYSRSHVVWRWIEATQAPPFESRVILNPHLQHTLPPTLLPPSIRLEPRLVLLVPLPLLLLLLALVLALAIPAFLLLVLWLSVPIDMPALVLGQLPRANVSVLAARVRRARLANVSVGERKPKGESDLLVRR